MNRVRQFVLLISDLAVLYISLILALWLRYRGEFYDQFKEDHLIPFSFIFAVWIVIFYVAGLYDLRKLRNGLEFIKTLSLSIFVNSLLAISLFYLIPTLGIAPKTNLFLFIAIFAILETYWRRVFNRAISSGEAHSRVLLIGNGASTEAIKEAIRTNPQLGYEIPVSLKEDQVNESTNLRKVVEENSINYIVVPRHLKKDTKLTNTLYDLLTSGAEVRDLPNFYELIFRKIPLADLEEAWFLENLIGHQKFYDPLKRAGEFMIALILGIGLLPLEILIALLIKATSPGSIIYRQERVGKSGKSFLLYKFRTMTVDAEKNGAKWADPNDMRATPLGKILRHTHLDELPQLWNVLKNELSFVGPRPERPEFVRLLQEKIPYYEIRHIVKPGVTGWAQINYKYGASVEDAYEKLQYDIYYLKNRSLILDISTMIRTIKSFFVNQE